MSPLEQRALDYIRNTGGRVTTAAFDDDHEPVGRQLRRALVEAGHIEEVDGVLRRRGFCLRQADRGRDILDRLALHGVGAPLPPNTIASEGVTIYLSTMEQLQVIIERGGHPVIVHQDGEILIYNDYVE